MAINIKMLGTEKRSNYKNVNKVFLNVIKNYYVKLQKQINLGIYINCL